MYINNLVEFFLPVKIPYAIPIPLFGLLPNVVFLNALGFCI